MSTSLSDLTVSSLGFGCMALSHVYGGTSDDEARATLDAVIDAGVTFLDTADVYGQPRGGARRGPPGPTRRCSPRSWPAAATRCNSRRSSASPATR